MQQKEWNILTIYILLLTEFEQSEAPETEIFIRVNPVIAF